VDLGGGTLANLAHLRDFKSRRLSSWDRSGGNADYVIVGQGKNVVLGEIEGAGVVRHVWMTMTSLGREKDELRQTVLRMFWDGEASPSVEVPLGDFFGIGFGLRRNFTSLPLQMSPQNGLGEITPRSRRLNARRARLPPRGTSAAPPSENSRATTTEPAGGQTDQRRHLTFGSPAGPAASR
jgi:Protein of unknown function (DUF2961)